MTRPRTCPEFALTCPKPATFHQAETPSEQSHRPRALWGSGRRTLDVWQEGGDYEPESGPSSHDKRRRREAWPQRSPRSPPDSQRRPTRREDREPVALSSSSPAAIGKPGAAPESRRAAHQRPVNAAVNEEPFFVDGSPVYIAMSVGVGAVRFDASSGPTALLRDADAALSQAKSAGKNRVVVAATSDRVRAGN